MIKQALILHAWLNGQDKHWYPWLKNELETRGYTVYLPEIPTMNSQNPDLQTQINFIEKTIPLDNNFIVFGHSLGCLLALRLGELHAFQKYFLSQDGILMILRSNTNPIGKISWIIKR